MNEPRLVPPNHGQPLGVGQPSQQRPTPMAPHPSLHHVPHASHAPHAPQPPHPHPSQRPGIAPMPVQPVKHNQDLDDPIELVDEITEDVTMPVPGVPGSPMPALPPAVAKPKIKAFGPEVQRREHNWKRQTHVTGQGACRVKSFHGKYSDQGIEHLDDVINEWLDNHPEVEVKFVTSTVNVFEGKIREPALVLNLWY